MNGISSTASASRRILRGGRFPLGAGVKNGDVGPVPPLGGGGGRLLVELGGDGPSTTAMDIGDPPMRLAIRPRTAVIAVALVAGLTAGGVMAARVVSTPTLEVSGPASGTAIGPLQDGRLVF